MGPEVLASPVVLVFVLVVVAAASAIHYRNPDQVPIISPQRLLLGYLSVGICTAAIAAASSYVSPAEALSKWHVPPENYWPVQARTFFVEYFFMACTALLGLALVGVPIVFALGRFGRATVPYVLLASIAVSMVAAVALSAGDSPAFRHFVFTVKYVVAQHLLLSIAFCISVGLPWRCKLNEA